MTDRAVATTSADSGPAVYNPFDPAFRADPYPFYDRLRTTAPAHVTPLGLTVLTRYDDVSHTLRSNDFSRDVDANATPREDPIFQRRRERSRSGAKTILNLDPPDHTRLRRLVSKAFTPSAIEALRVRIEQQVDTVLDVAAERGSMELVDELAFPVPFQVISDLLDLPQDRTDEIREWSQLITASLEPTSTLETLDASDQAVGQLVPYLMEVVEARRTNLGSDVLSALLVAEEAGDRLSTEELLSFVVLLYVAGHETTVNLIGNGMFALLKHPDELDRWRRDPSLDAVAVDELLRYDGPVQHTVRVAMTPVSYGEGDQRVEV
ncbi:MAG: cytochrome P450, partial [Ilumatobacteraceae bacterium]